MADDALLFDGPAGREAELDRGFYAKFEARRIDAEAQARHAGCRVFVLDVDDDPNAAGALLAYAQAWQETQPSLAADLRRLVGHHLGGSLASHPSSGPCLVGTGSRPLSGELVLTSLCDRRGAADLVKRSFQAAGRQP